MSLGSAAGSSQAMIRTYGSIMGAQYTRAMGTLYAPRAPVLNKAHIREEIEMQYIAGPNFGVGITGQWQASRDIDVTPYVILRFVAGAIPVANWNGGATFARYVDNLGLGCWEEIEVKSGTQRMQTIYPEELMLYILNMLDISARANALAAVGNGTPLQRTNRALVDQEINVPLFTNMGFRLHGDPSQALYTRGLNDLLTWRIKFRAAADIIETDGTLPTAPANGFLQSGRMIQVGQHIQEDERQMLLSFYSQHAFAIHFDDVQYASRITIPAATALPGSLLFPLTNITQPVTSLFFLFRWRNDIERTVPSAFGTQGKDLWNWTGAYNAGGGTQEPIIASLRLSTGNTDIVKTVPIKRLLGWQHYVDFQGPANTPSAGYSYSHNPAITNSCLGFVSFEQIERPQLTINLQVPPAGVAFATVGAAANADIGTAAGSSDSDLLCDVIAFTKNEIAVAKYLLARAFN